MLRVGPHKSTDRADHPWEPRLSHIPTSVGHMATPSTSSGATDRHGNLLPAIPTAEDVATQADQLRIIPDAELPAGVLDRMAPADLEQRRRQTIDR